MAPTRPAQAASPSRTAGSRGRRQYAPQPHPGTRDRWSDEAILRALRDWTDELGRPPRRQEWSGEQPYDAGSAQRKWMREHPYWPSSSCVANHFGSWSKGLAAAGLIERAREFDDSVAERVATARQLRAAGCSVRAIAQQLGVSRLDRS